MLRRVKVLPVIMLTLLCLIPTQGEKAASFIRVVQDEGIWWFEDGRGQRFFSLGVNCIGGCFGHAEKSAMEDSRKRWIVGHLMEQGFNTAASWSSPSVWDHFYVSDQIYTGFREEQDDVFDDSLWKERFEPCIREEVKPFFGKTNFIGYFIDNEPKWSAVNTFKLYLGLPAEMAGSRAFIAFLETYYQGSIAKLIGEWGRSYGGFGDIPKSFCPTDFPTAMEKGVLRAWRNEVAKTYYSRYAALLRSLDPDHLILGVRYRGIPDLDLFKALSPYFDVNSVNDYNRYGNLKPDFETLYKASGKPLMITEFSFSGFPEPGHRSMLFVDVYSQENRGIGYEKSVLGAARAPFMLGMHWFFWMDYPKQNEAEGGFLPDENVGLVTNDESRTYEELGQWIKRTNRAVYSVHRAAYSLSGPAPVLAKKLLAPFTPKLDGNTSEWPEETVLKPSTVTCLIDGGAVEHTYYVSRDREAVYVACDVSDSHLDNPGGEWYWNGDGLFLHLSPDESLGSTALRDISLFICPVGSGTDKSQPLAVRWRGPDESTMIPIEVATNMKAGGVTIEAKVPWGLLERSGTEPASKLTLGYQNANEICQASWSGMVSFVAKGGR